MSAANPNTPRVGIPWRTSQEEAEQNRGKLQNYENAVREAGGEPVILPLSDPQKLRRELPALDAFVLPGSPADVAPVEYGAADTGLSAPADRSRELTDRMVLDHAIAERKPVLAICYGCQLLNVFLGGTLTQDLRVETGTATPHRRNDVVPEAKEDPWHGAKFSADSRLAVLAGSTDAPVNSSHHQAIATAGKNLRITARAPEDNTIEAVEWTGDSNWIVGVQWHPERMNDAFTARLFRDFIQAASRARDSVTQKA